MLFHKKTNAIFFTVTISLSLFLVATAQAQTSSSEIYDAIENQRRQIDRARQEIAGIDTLLLNEEQTLQKNRLELAEVTAQLDQAEEQYNATLNQFENRITAIYKLGEDKYYSVILSSDSFTDALTRISHLSTISRSDLELVKRIKEEAEQVRILHARIDSLKQTRAEDIDELKLQRSRLLAQIDSDNDRLEEAQAELARAEVREQEEAALLAADEGSLLDDFMPSLGISALANQPPPGLKPTGAVLGGIASWYGPGFHGNTTANGEKYNMFAFTAAHKTLPFNTWVKVTFNGRSVFLRINDRGPYIAGRIIDLSYAGSQAVGLSGIGHVTVEIYR